jgi:hypothetical protein
VMTIMVVHIVGAVFNVVVVVVIRACLIFLSSGATFPRNACCWRHGDGTAC